MIFSVETVRRSRQATGPMCDGSTEFSREVPLFCNQAFRVGTKLFVVEQIVGDF